MKCKKHKTLTTIFTSFDTFVNIALTTSSIALILTGFGLKATPISTASACAFSIGNKVIYEIIITKYNKCKQHYRKEQQN